MARILIVGCGCRGRQLARALIADGHAVRGTTRSPAHAEAIAAAGAEPWIGDPDRIASLTRALEHVTVLVWPLAGATGPDPERLAALHGTRLEMLLERTIDTTVRGFVYEAAGSLPDDVLAAGRETVRAVCARNEIPVAVLEEPPGDGWAAAAYAAVSRLLS